MNIMKKGYKIILIIAIIMAYGIINGLLIPETKMSTLMACSCTENFTGEFPCNSISSEKYYFSFLGFFNIYRAGAGKEMIICNNGEQTGTRIDLNDYSIKFDLQFNRAMNIMGSVLAFIQFNGMIILTIILVYLVIKKL
jgi:hypothetical protein